MICNLESEGEEKGALSLCSAFLKRQLLQGDVYCAWWVFFPSFFYSENTCKCVVVMENIYCAIHF